MHACPHCTQPGINSMQKLNSYFFAPAKCCLCRKYSYLHYKHGVRAMIAWVLLTWVFIGVALFQQMSIYLIGTVPALLLAVDKYMLRASLQAML